MLSIAWMLLGSGALAAHLPAVRVVRIAQPAPSARLSTHVVGFHPLRVPFHLHKRQRPTICRVRARVVAAAAGLVGSSASDDDAAAKRHRQRLRIFVLTLLVVQNALSALLTRWTRVKRLDVPMYYDSTAVLVTELMKVPMCLLMMVGTLGPRGALADLREGFSKPLEILQLAVPALCYTLQNILFYVALTSLSASTYQVLSQTKTLATAVFWVTMLGGRLVPRQWVALTVLVAGVSAVQLDGSSAGGSGGGSYVLGIAAVLASSLLSGFANVFFERLVKTTPTSIWVRNLQLAVFGIPQALLFMMKDSAAISATGALQGFDAAVWTAVALKALGGLVVASTVKFADSLLKSFATAISIIVTCVISIPLYGNVPSLQFVQGVLLVIASLFLYNVKQPPKPKPSENASR